MFFIVINAGSMISIFLTPIFRADLDCYPHETDPIFDECYAMAIGVPAASLVVASSRFFMYCITVYLRK